MKPPILFFLLIVSNCLQAQIDTALTDLPKKPTEAFKIDFNGFKIPNGGHFQGVQMTGDGKYIIISGSSNTEAYCIVVEYISHKVVHYQKLMEKPMKHAGGFQIWDNHLAIGIEDNDAKDTSMICVYNIKDVFNWQRIDSLTIERKGTPKDKTAGAVGLFYDWREFSISVANWGSKELDFYHYEMNWVSTDSGIVDYIKSKKPFFIQQDQRDSKEIRSYQNINYLENKIAGFYRSGKMNKCDLLKCTHRYERCFWREDIKTFVFKGDYINFQHAAGISLVNNKYWLLSTAKGKYISIFKPKKSITSY